MPILNESISSFITNPIGSLASTVVSSLGFKGSYTPADLSKSPLIDLYRKIMTLKNESGILVFSDYGASLAVRYSIGDLPTRDNRDKKEKELAAHYWSEAQRFMKLPINGGVAVLTPVPPVVSGNRDASSIVADGGNQSSNTVLIIMGLLVLAGGIWYATKGK